MSPNNNPMNNYASYAVGLPHAEYSDKISSVSPLTHAANVLDSASELAMRINRLADRIVGFGPPTEVGQAGGASPAPSAAFHALSAKASSVSGMVQDAFASLDRIESQLP